MDHRGLKILAIADLCITEDMYRRAFAGLTGDGAELKVIEWKVRDLNDLRAQIETQLDPSRYRAAWEVGQRQQVAEVVARLLT